MTRFLLALLAMLTGIAFTGQPVSARVCGDEASAARSATCAVVVEGINERALAVEASAGPPDRQTARGAAPALTPAVFVHSYRERCTRALE